MLDAERGKVLKVRSSGTIPHEVVEDVLATLDVEESMLDVRNERLAELEGAETVSGIPGTTYSCEHLDAAPRDADSDPAADADKVCEDCVRGRVHQLGAPAQVPVLRAPGVLRLLAAAARQRALRATPTTP